MAKKKNKKKVTSKKKPVTKNKTNKKDISGTTSQDTKLTFINHLVVVDRALKNHIRKIESLKTQNYSKSQLLRYLDKMLFEIDIVITKSEVFIKKHPSCSKLAGEAKILLELMVDDLFDGCMAIYELRISKGCYELAIDAYRAAYRYGGDLKKIAGQLYSTASKEDRGKITHAMLLHVLKTLDSMRQTGQRYTERDDLSRLAELFLINVDEKPPLDKCVTLRNFIKDNCDISKKNDRPDRNELQIYKRKLQDAHNKGIINLPAPKEKKRKSGQAYTYFEQELRVRYLEYCKDLNLPPLK